LSLHESRQDWGVMPWTHCNALQRTATQQAVPAAAYWVIDPDTGGRFDV